MEETGIYFSIHSRTKNSLNGLPFIKSVFRQVDKPNFCEDGLLEWTGRRHSRCELYACDSSAWQVTAQLLIFRNINCVAVHNSTLYSWCCSYFNINAPLCAPFSNSVQFKTPTHKLFVTVWRIPNEWDVMFASFAFIRRVRTKFWHAFSKCIAGFAATYVRPSSEQRCLRTSVERDVMCGMVYPMAPRFYIYRFICNVCARCIHPSREMWCSSSCIHTHGVRRMCFDICIHPPGEASEHFWLYAPFEVGRCSFAFACVCVYLPARIRSTWCCIA